MRSSEIQDGPLKEREFPLLTPKVEASPNIMLEAVSIPPSYPCILDPLTPTRLDLIIRNGMQNEPGQIIWSVHRMSLTPVISNGVSKELAIAAECSRGDSTPNRREGLQSRVSNAIPEMICAVRSSRGEDSLILRVERDVVDSPNIDVLLRIWMVSVASKGKIDTINRTRCWLGPYAPYIDDVITELGIRGVLERNLAIPVIFLVHGVTSAPSLDTRGSPSFSIWESPHHRRLMLER